MISRPRVLAVTAILLAITTLATAANATTTAPSTTPQPTIDDPCGRNCDGGGGVAPGPHPAVEAEVHRFVPGSVLTASYPSGSSYLDACTFELATAGTTIIVGVASASAPVTIDVDHWVVSCPLEATGGNIIYTYYPDGDPPSAVIIADMINDAYQRTPVIAFNPISSPPGDENIMLITRMITYLWVDDTAWNTPATATATIPGFSVTTQALPRDTHWTGGDQPAWCAGADMHPYVFGIGDDAQPSRCSMIYKRSSALQDNHITLAVNWDVGYTCSIPVCGGALPDITTNSTRNVIVGEIQAINT